MSTTRDDPAKGAKEQPEALASFAAAARSADGLPPEGGRTSTPETRALPADNDRKAEAATKVLREGTLHVDQGADEAVDRLPDRTRSTQP